VAIPQVMARQGTGANVLGLGTGPNGLFVPAAMEMPVALQLGTSGAPTKALLDLPPRRSTVLFHVVVGDLVRDALVAQSRHQPVKDGAGVAVADRRLDLFGP